MSLSTVLTRRASGFLDDHSTRRGFLTRTAVVGSALSVAGPAYVSRPRSAYAAVCGCNGSTCDCSDLCCDGYTEFCCRVYGDNSCPPGSILAGWWKVDNSHFCAGEARYYMDCNRTSPGCSCGRSGVCSGDTPCQCRNCGDWKDGCTTFRYGNCNNDVSCVGPILCRVVTCAKPWEVDPGCSTVARTDDNTRFHHRACLGEPTAAHFSFVEALYRDFLNRSSDPVGRETWAGQLATLEDQPNEGRHIVARWFAFSSEYVGVVVDDLYRVALDRAADPEGRRVWIDQIRRGAKPSQIAVEIMSSSEFHGLAGRTDNGFVRRVYDRVLGRVPSGGEVAFWIGLLDQGADRAEVVELLFQSQESRRRRVAALYQRFLDRSPDPVGHAFWARVIERDEDVALAIFLVSSTEYAGRAVRRFGAT